MFEIYGGESCGRSILSIFEYCRRVYGGEKFLRELSLDYPSLDYPYYCPYYFVDVTNILQIFFPGG